MHPEEYLDLVDENDEVIETKLRVDIYAEGLNNFRVINAFLKNSKGQLWIPRRTAHKAIFPLGLDFSAAGHVSSGETYEETFAREVAEEINIDISKVEYKELGYSTPKDGTKQFMKVYEILCDETPTYNTDDFVEYFWLTPEELLARHEAGELMKGDLPFMVKRFYLGN